MWELLTQGDLCLHGHGQRRVLDLAAEQGVVVQLGVEGPGEPGLHHHRAVALRDVSVAEVVERVRAVHPAGELPAHHRLRDDLRGRAGLGGLLALGVHALGDLGVEPGRSPLGVQEGEGALQLGVVQVPADERPGPSHPRRAAALLGGGGQRVGDHLDQLAVPLEVHLRKNEEQFRDKDGEENKRGHFVRLLSDTGWIISWNHTEGMYVRSSGAVPAPSWELKWLL